MRHPIAKTIAASVIGVMVLATVGGAAVPTVRHIASGWWNNPEGLAALPENPQVPMKVAHPNKHAPLPHSCQPPLLGSRPRMGVLAHPIIVGVYVTPESFVAANGLRVAGLSA